LALVTRDFRRGAGGVRLAGRGGLGGLLLRFDAVILWSPLALTGWPMFSVRDFVQTFWPTDGRPAVYESCKPFLIGVIMTGFRLTLRGLKLVGRGLFWSRRG